MAIICPCPHLSGKLSSTTRKVRTMTDIKYYVVEFLEKDDSIWSMAIKVNPGYTPTIEDIETFLKPDMAQFEYDHVHDFYEVDEDEIYAGYDTDNIDSWPVLGA